MMLFPAFYPPQQNADPVFPDLHHTPYRFYVRVAEPVEGNPPPPVRFGRQSVLGYDNQGTYMPLIEPAQVMRIAGDPKLIGDDLLMTIWDIETNRYFLRRFSGSVKPAENIWEIELSGFGGGTYQLTACFPARKAAVVDRFDSVNSVQFKRYKDGGSWYYLRDNFFAPPSAAISSTPNAAAINLGFNARDACFSYRRAIASNEWCYAAAYGGDANRIIGFKGRSADDASDPLDEVPLWIPVDGAAPAGDIFSINAVAFLGGDHCVMQAVYFERTPNPNPNIVSPNNPWRTHGDLYTCRVYRVNLINGRAQYSEIASVVNDWRPIGNTQFFEPFQVLASGSVITALCMTPNGEVMQTYPWNGTNINGSSGFVSFCYVNPSLIIATSRLIGTGAQRRMFVSRNNGSSWSELPSTVVDVPGFPTAHISRGAYCVRRDLRVKRSRKDWIISREIQI